jgi:hypothetical protein
MSFEEFMQTFKGSTINDIRDKSSYVNLYMGNKHGFNKAPVKDENLKKFANAFVAFVNKDIFKHRPQQRIYDTQEFKDDNNYEEYKDLDQQRRGMFRQLIGKTDEERKDILRKKQI